MSDQLLLRDSFDADASRGNIEITAAKWSASKAVEDAEGGDLNFKISWVAIRVTELDLDLSQLRKLHFKTPKIIGNWFCLWLKS